MTPKDAKELALAAVRRRYGTAIAVLEEHIQENALFYGSLESDTEVERVAETWLEVNGFGPETIRYRNVHSVFEESELVI